MMEFILYTVIFSTIGLPIKIFSSAAINLADIKTFLQYFKFIGTNEEPPPLTPKLFLTIVQKGKELVKQTKSLSGEELGVLNLVTTGSIATSPPQSIARILKKYDKDSDYSYEILLYYDDSGKICKFFYDYPMATNEDIISSDHVSIILEYVKNKDYHSISSKGCNIFKKGKQLPSGYKDIFKDYLAKKDKNILTYAFYSVQGKGGFATATLEVDDSSNKVIAFLAMEGWR